LSPRLDLAAQYNAKNSCRVLYRHKVEEFDVVEASSPARNATAEALAQELDLDLTPEFFNNVDRFLMQLWMRGFKVTELPDEK
jgi:hypothetical protein